MAPASVPARRDPFRATRIEQAIERFSPGQGEQAGNFAFWQGEPGALQNLTVIVLEPPPSADAAPTICCGISCRCAATCRYRRER